MTSNSFTETIQQQNKVNPRYSIITILAIFLLCQTTVLAQEEKPAKTHKQHITRFETKPENKVFIPKGSVLLGCTAGCNSIQGDNINFLMLKNISGVEGYLIDVGPYIGGFVDDNLAIGGKFNYSRYMASLGNFDLNLGTDMNISLKDLYAISHTYQGSFFLRYYIPFGNSRIFAMFAEGRLSYSRSQGKNVTGSGADLDGTYIVGHKAGLYFNPGLCVFMCDCVAAEISVGVLGIDYGWKDSVTNQIETGSIKSRGAKLGINLLSANIGISFCF